jgi:hypothetical protein
LAIVIFVSIWVIPQLLVIFWGVSFIASIVPLFC